MSNNRIILEGCISQFKAENQLGAVDSEIFELFTLTQITKSHDITFENILNSIVDGGNDGGIDSVIVIINDEVIESIDDLSEIKFTQKTIARFIISQCKKESSFKESTIDKLISLTRRICGLPLVEEDFQVCDIEPLLSRQSS